MVTAPAVLALALALAALPHAGAASAPMAATSESVGWQNFGKMLLVFGCIGSDFCKKICVLQHFAEILPADALSSEPRRSGSSRPPGEADHFAVAPERRLHAKHPAP